MLYRVNAYFRKGCAVDVRNVKIADMGKYLVIFISLKNVEGLSFEEAQYQLVELIGMEAERFHFLLDGDRLTEK